MIPELTEEQRIESFIKHRISSTSDAITFTRKELAEFCLKQIDYAVDLIKNTSYEEVEEQFEED